MNSLGSARAGSARAQAKTRERKDCFFEKKQQKTFESLDRGCRDEGAHLSGISRSPIRKASCFFFSKKKALLLLA
jgi:hypothetical protein